MEKTTGESAVKVKSVEASEGLYAYFKIYWWFVRTSGIAVQELSRKCMHQEPIVKEERMMDHLEAWEADLKVIALHADYGLKDNHKMIALEIMFSKFPGIFETIERTCPEKKKTNMKTF